MVSLKRSVSLPLLVFYGMGTMIGAGFYALLGKVAGEAGAAAPMAFLPPVFWPSSSPLYSPSWHRVIPTVPARRIM